jgi:hypothetical protein
MPVNAGRVSTNFPIPHMSALPLSEAVHLIDPDLLVQQCKQCICDLCYGVIIKPVSGCPDGHSFCRACYVKALVRNKSCPACRAVVQDENTLVPNRLAESFIDKLVIRCEHAYKQSADEANPPKRAKCAPLTVQALRAALTQHGLDSNGVKSELVARLEKYRKKASGCEWSGNVEDLTSHRGVCAWTKCPNTGCSASPLRTNLLLEHGAICEHRKITCGHCRVEVPYLSLTDHEALCPDAEIVCPNENCSETERRCLMQFHRGGCQHEQITCNSPECYARLPRKDITAHVRACHMHSRNSAEEMLQEMWGENAARTAASESELRNSAGSPISCVFNWRAGWGPNLSNLSEYSGYCEDTDETQRYRSEMHNFGGEWQGYGVFGLCDRPDEDDSHFIGLRMENDRAEFTKCLVHATFSILDKNDTGLCQIYEEGTDMAPVMFDFKEFLCAEYFTPTAEDKAQSMRADGSIRMRAVVRLFID